MIVELAQRFQTDPTTVVFWFYYGVMAVAALCFWYLLTAWIARREFYKCIRDHTVVKFVQPPRDAKGHYKKAGR